jgi:hypothetical protein
MQKQRGRQQSSFLRPPRRASELKSRADELNAEAEILKADARLEDLHIWQMEKAKITKKGSRSYFFSSCTLLTEISI